MTSKYESRRNDFEAIAENVTHTGETIVLPCDSVREMERITRAFNRWRRSRAQQDYDEGLPISDLEYITVVKDTDKIRIIFKKDNFLTKPVYTEDGTLLGTVNDLRERARQFYASDDEIKEADIDIDVDDL